MGAAHLKRKLADCPCTAGMTTGAPKEGQQLGMHCKTLLKHISAGRCKDIGQLAGCSAPGLTSGCSAGFIKKTHTYRSVSLLVAGEAECRPAATLHVQRLRANVLHTLDGMLAACKQSATAEIASPAAYIQTTSPGQAGADVSSCRKARP